MKKLKLYIPVVIKGVVGKPKTYRTTYVNVMTIALIVKLLPSLSEIQSHLETQKTIKELTGKAYSSLKIVVKEAEFELLQNEITKKLGKKYQGGVLDLITEINTIPIIQIVPESNSQK